MKTIKTILAILAALMVLSVPAMAGVDVSAYRQLVSTGTDSVIGSARDGDLRGTVTTSLILNEGTTGLAWVTANVYACDDGSDSYTWSYSDISAGSFLDDAGTDSLSASSAGTAVVTYQNVPRVQTTSNSVLSMSLAVSANSLWAGTRGYANAWADADIFAGTWTYNDVYGDVGVGTDDGWVYAIAWGESIDPALASVSLDVSVTVNGETASATLEGTATATAI